MAAVSCLALRFSDIFWVEFACQRHAGGVICVGTDETSSPPVPGTADMAAESGRGLQIVPAPAAGGAGWCSHHDAVRDGSRRRDSEFGSYS
jgi:hypothetical protein